MSIVRLTWIWLLCCGAATAAELTHGPMVGHTTSTTTRIWVRADQECDFQVRVTPHQGGNGELSERIRLRAEDNFCGSVRTDKLRSKTLYRYEVLLNGQPQDPSLTQTLTTFPDSSAPGIVRIGFGHSVIGPGEQVTWRAIGEKEPDLFILMGDNIYSNSTEPAKQRQMYLHFRADPHFRAFGAKTPIYAVWDDHDYGVNNSDRTQPGKKRSLKTFNELWPNPPLENRQGPGIWSRFSVGQAELFLLDVRYHRSPNTDPDGPEKTMLGTEQRDWLADSLAKSQAVFKFPVSGSSWNCGGKEAWNHQFTYEYDWLLNKIIETKVSGVILLGGDQHLHKIGVRPRETWGGYDLHEWMAGQIWNKFESQKLRGFLRGFGMITIDTTVTPATSRLEFFDGQGGPRQGRRILYTPPGALRTLWDSPPGVLGEKPPRSVDGELRPNSSGPVWESLPQSTSETLTEDDLRLPHSEPLSDSKSAPTFSKLKEFNVVASPAANNRTAITHVTLIDGRGGDPVPDATVLISGNRIEAVGSAKDLQVPADTEVIDGTGLSVLPGLIDSHFHIGSSSDMLTIPSLFLSHGVTTARDPGRPIEVYAPLKGPKSLAPRLFLTGPHFDQDPPAWPKNAVVIDSPTHAGKAVRKYVEEGATGIKVYFRLSLESVQQTCKTAGELGIPVTAHLELIDADDAIEAGVIGIEHVTSFGTVLADPRLAGSFRDSVMEENDARKDGRYRLWAGIQFDKNKRVQPLLDLIVKKGVFVSPTLATFERRAGDRKTQDFHVQGFEKMMQFVGRCQDAGAIVVTGSHTWSKHVDLGWAFQREMELLVESGLTPLEVISASTINNARFLGCAERLGTLEAGKLADLVLVQGRPDKNIRAMYDVRRVMQNGVWYDDMQKN